MKKHYMWMLRSESEVFFAMGPGRNLSVVYELLGLDRPFVLVSDGYEAYDSYSKDSRARVIHAGCYSHARRKFTDAEKQDKEKAGVALDRYFQPLYRIEAEIREKKLAGDAKKEYRQRHARPIVHSLKDWLTKTQSELSLLPKSPLAVACSYMLSRWDKFLVYLDHPDVPIDTNEGEREMRPHALGRNNWKVNMSKEGSHYVATFYSIVQSCTLVGVDPFDYLVDILPKLAERPKGRCPELAPLAWKTARGQAAAGP
jgi:transposase